MGIHVNKWQSSCMYFSCITDPVDKLTCQTKPVVLA
jgi:hypothetical protein